ncbi:hypothetical protein SanaruYs_04900 [Chryseotalea sanaruensis]|uniref:Uncharacterized protein n=1 Tax=Chryseotalea sanaruensis TaxID=2482724 RepID=A0A401U5W6_9BACT|nr:hypothetical protein SanaruYs_04900 [Chryseotalea sanaruensis]
MYANVRPLILVMLYLGSYQHYYWTDVRNFTFLHINCTLLKLETDYTLYPNIEAL